MVPRKIVGSDPGTVRSGHSHVLNVQLRNIIPRHVASTPLTVHGVTVTSRPEYAPECSPQKLTHRSRLSRATKAQGDNNTGCVFDQLCTASGHTISVDCASPQDTTAMAFFKYRDSTREAICLEHHVFDGQWVARPSKHHPMLLVTMTPSSQDHVSFSTPMRDTSKLTSVTMAMVAHTVQLFL